MPGFVGLPELLLFGIVALLIFGPKKLPEMGRSLGKGLREFKDSVSTETRPTVLEGSDRSILQQMEAGDSVDPLADVNSHDVDDHEMSGTAAQER